MARQNALDCLVELIRIERLLNDVNEKISEEKDTDFAVRLTRENGVASIPVSVFYNHPREAKVLRFCFAKGEETLLKAGKILRNI